jgi:hypothetical protein
VFPKRKQLGMYKGGSAPHFLTPSVPLPECLCLQPPSVMPVGYYTARSLTPRSSIKVMPLEVWPSKSWVFLPQQ